MFTVNSFLILFDIGPFKRTLTILNRERTLVVILETFRTVFEHLKIFVKQKNAQRRPLNRQKRPVFEWYSFA